MWCKLLFCVLLLAATNVHAGIVLRSDQSVYATQTLGAFVVDQINGIPCSSCDSVLGRLVLPGPSTCAGEVGSHFRSCTKNASITGIVLGSNNTWPIDFYTNLYIKQAGIGQTASLNTAAYAFNVDTGFFHVTHTIQYDGFDDGSFCIKGPDGITGGLGGIDLSQGGTQNAIAINSLLGDGDRTYDVTIYDTQGNWERQVVTIPVACVPPCAGSSDVPYYTRYTVGDNLYTVIPFTNMSIFSDVDAIELKFHDNPGTFINGLEYAIGLNAIQTAFVDGCRFVEQFRSPELTSKRSDGLCYEAPGDGAMTPFATHTEYRTCFAGNPVDPGVHNFQQNGAIAALGPLTYTKNTWMELPYGNTFSFDDLTNYSTIVNPVGLITIQYRSSGSFGGIPGAFPNQGVLEGLMLGFSVFANPFPVTGYGLVQLDFATQPDDSLFRTVTVYMRHAQVFVSPNGCTGTTVTYMATPLDVNLAPLSAPIPFVLTGGPPVYTGSFVYDAGGNVLRGVLVDFGSITCTIASFPTNFVVVPSITRFDLTADGNCHRPATRTPCHTLRGSAFYDIDLSGSFNEAIDTYIEENIVVRIQPLPLGPTTYLDYASISSLNGTYYTECYDVGTVLEIFVEPPVGMNLTTANNPQLYTVTDDCENIIPPVGFESRFGVAFKVYNDLNNNGVYDMGEPGFPNIQFKTTKLNAPLLGEMLFGVSDMMGNVLIPNVQAGEHLLDMLDVIFGYTQTEGMDPTNLTLAVMVANSTTMIGNFGFHIPQVTCASSGPMRLFVDHFDGPNTTATLQTNMTHPNVFFTEIVGTGLGGEVDVQLISTGMSMYATGNTSTVAVYMTYPNTTSLLFLQWDGAGDGSLMRQTAPGLGGADLTQGGNATAICISFTALVGDYRSTMVVGSPATGIETQTIYIASGSSKATFFFIDASVYQSVTFLELTLEVINPTPAMHAAFIDYVAAECALCQQIITFDENDWSVGQNSASLAVPFQQLNDRTKVLPYAHFTQFTQNNHTIAVLGPFSQALVTSDPSDTLYVDFDATKSDPQKVIRSVSLDVRVVPQDNTTAGCSGPIVRVFDALGVQIFERDSTTLTLLLMGSNVYGDTIVLDAGENRIGAISVDYSPVTCTNTSVVLMGLNSIHLSVDGPCGGILQPLVQPRSAWQPIVIMSPFIFVVFVALACFLCCGGSTYVVKRRRKLAKRFIFRVHARSFFIR